jgi:hypothetical protein
MANPIPVFWGLVGIEILPQKTVWDDNWVAGECDDDDDIGCVIEGTWITWSREVAHASAPCMVVRVMMIIEGTW